MKAALYVRVSTAHQIDKDSLPMQKQDLEQYCKLILNLDDFEIFEDAGYSAKNTDRPAFQNMMEYVLHGMMQRKCGVSYAKTPRIPALKNKGKVI